MTALDVDAMTVAVVRVVAVREDVVATIVASGRRRRNRCLEIRVAGLTANVTRRTMMGQVGPLRAGRIHTRLWPPLLLLLLRRSVLPRKLTVWLLLLRSPAWLLSLRSPAWLLLRRLSGWRLSRKLTVWLLLLRLNVWLLSLRPNERMPQKLSVWRLSLMAVPLCRPEYAAFAAAPTVVGCLRPRLAVLAFVGRQEALL
jgi:hypothetical protein